MHNFTQLPQEIKDLVYDELVGPVGEVLSFYPNVLGVSKSIREQALTRMLLASGGFVKISWKGPTLQTAINGFKVPFVCASASRYVKFTHHCLEIHIGNVNDAGYHTQRRLLLVRDLPLFTDAVQHALFRREPPLVPSALTGFDPWTKSQAYEGYTVMELDFVTQQAAEQLTLLSHFRKCCSGRHDVVFQQTAIPKHQLLDFRLATSSKRMFLEAAAWAFLQNLSRVQKRIEDLFDHADYKGAVELANYVLLTWYDNMLLKYVVRKDPEVPLREPLSRVGLAMLDISVIAFAAYVKTHDLAGMRGIFNHKNVLNGFLRHLRYSSPLYSVAPNRMVVHSGQSWCYLIMSELVEDGASFARDYNAIPVVGEAIQAYAHDAEVISSLQKQQAVDGEAGPNTRLSETFGVNHVLVSLSVNKIPSPKAKIFKPCYPESALPQDYDGESWVNTVEEPKLAAQEMRDAAERARKTAYTKRLEAENLARLSSLLKKCRLPLHCLRQ